MRLSELNTVAARPSACWNGVTWSSSGSNSLKSGHSSIEQMVPRFDRFFDAKESVDERLRGLVFGPRSRYRAPVVGLDGQSGGATVPVRALPPDWSNPADGGPDAPLMASFHSADEYTLYQANRFYKRSTPTTAQLAKRRPDLKNVAPPIKLDDFDFHRIVASLGDVPAVLRGLKEFGEPTRKALIMELAPEDRKAAMFGLYYLLRDVVVSVAAFGGAFLWRLDPAVNLFAAFGCGLLATLWFAWRGEDEPLQRDPQDP